MCICTKSNENGAIPCQMFWYHLEQIVICLAISSDLEMLHTACFLLFVAVKAHFIQLCVRLFGLVLYVFVCVPFLNWKRIAVSMLSVSAFS